MSGSVIPVQEVVFVSAVRTPVGSIRGVLSSLSATDLGALAIRGALDKSGMGPGHVDQVIMGNVLSAGVGQAPARSAALKAGLLESTVCTTVNKVCASGMKAITLAAQSLQLGQSRAIVAGGMESMSNAPFYCVKAREGFPMSHQTLYDAILLDGLTDSKYNVLMGECAEISAAKHHVDRSSQDAFARRSYQKASDAWSKHLFATEIIPVPVPSKKAPNVVVEDEEYKKMDLDRISSLRTVFRKDGGTITVGNASKVSDGAAAVLLCTSDLAGELHVKPLARLISYADAEGDPVDFPTAPTLAIRKALERANLQIKDMSLFEINEAFSSVVLANQNVLGIPLEKINVAGGAVALGHPIGASGCRIVVTLIHLLKQGQYGCAAICNGGGGATALVLQKV